MATMKRHPRSGTSPSWMVTIAVSSVLFAQTSAMAVPNLEGTWKLASPKNTLMPLQGGIPFTAQGRKAYAENKRLQSKGDFDEYDITKSRCSSPGVPRLMLTSGRFKIWQRFGVLTFDFEWNRALRQIDASTLPPKPDFFGQALVPTMTGPSKGHWEGETLVAETTNLSDRALIDDLVPHTFDVKITEHLRLIDADTLEDKITIEDAGYFKHSWDAVLTFKRQPDALFSEDVCLDRQDAHPSAVVLQ